MQLVDELVLLVALLLDAVQLLVAHGRGFLELTPQAADGLLVLEAVAAVLALLHADAFLAQPQLLGLVLDGLRKPVLVSQGFLVLLLQFGVVPLECGQLVLALLELALHLAVLLLPVAHTLRQHMQLRLVVRALDGPLALTALHGPFDGR